MANSITFAPAARLGMAGLLAAGLALAGCDVIHDPVPPKVTSTLTPQEQTRLDSLDNLRPDPANAQRVLIEDLTGQYCGNCPSAARTADSLARQFPGRVLVTEVHVTDYFARPRLPDFPLDFRVPVVSEELVTAYDLDNKGLPQGAINRAPFAASNNNPVATYRLWPGAVATELARTPGQELALTTQYDPATRTLRLKVASHYLTNLDASVRLGIVLTEDSLLGTQKDYRAPAGTVQQPGQETPNYAHRHVLRAALAGTFGTEQVSKPAAGQRFNTYLRYTLPAAWVARRCGVIAYLANGDTRHILQVAEAKVIE